MLEEMEAVIFDLDGTLVDSMWVLVEIDKEYIEKYHLRAPEEGLVLQRQHSIIWISFPNFRARSRK